MSCTWRVLQPADLGTRSRQGPGLAGREPLLCDVVDRLLLVAPLQVVVDEPGCIPKDQFLAGSEQGAQRLLGWAALRSKRVLSMPTLS